VADAVDKAVLDLVRCALAEDVGSGDVTTRATVPPDATAVAVITQKAPGVLFGLDIAATVFRELDAELAFTAEAPEGEWREPGGRVATIEGHAGSILTAERTALNFLGHLSGVATATAMAVRAVEGTGARILDTRKTIPGLRALQKAAVAAGGATNHRFGLYDAVMVKENHADLAGGVGPAVRAARERYPDLRVTAEARDLDDVRAAVEAGADQILLDNMGPDRLREAVALIGGRADAEASGGIDLENLAAHAATGVQFLSLGALTHSARALDISLTLLPQS
jgi:nicotinate-nucleotide pyrophosphorylase (carboxylating)